MRRIVWLVALLLSLALPALAQTAPEPRPEAPKTPEVSSTWFRVYPPWSCLPALTPDCAAAIALQRSTDVAIADEGVAWRGLSDPGARPQRPYGRFQASIAAVGLSSSFNTPEHTESLGAVVDLPLYMGGRDRFSRQAAAGRRGCGCWSVEAAKLAVVQAARRAVLNLLRLQQLAAVAQQKVTGVAEHLRITNAMFEAGATPRFEVVQAETNLADAKGSVITAQIAVSLLRAEIANLLNIPQRLDIPAEEGVPYQAPEGDLNQLTELALQQRPEIKSLQAQVDAQAANVRLAQANNNPSVTFEAAVNNQTTSIAITVPGWSLSVGANWPIYLGGQTRGKVTVAQAALQTACLNVEKTTQQIALEVTQSLDRINDSRQALAIAEQGEVNARERARIADVRFANGVGLGVEVLDAQTALATAQADVINARFNMQVAIVNLWSAMGLCDLPKEPAS